MPQFFEQKQAKAIQQMFDARLESIVIHSRFLDLIANQATFNTDDILKVATSKLSLKEPGLQLLLGRNGSGKSTLLKFLESFGSGSKSVISGSLVFSLPSDELLDIWNAEVDELVDQAKGYEGWEYPGHLYDELKWVASLPISEKIKKACNNEKTSIKVNGDIVSYHEIADWLGLREVRTEDNGYRQRYSGDFGWEDCGPPINYSPRPHVATWILKAIESGESTIVIDFVPVSKPWINPSQAVLSDEWFEDDDRKKLRSVGAAYEQFLESCTHFELNEKNQFRFLAPMPQSGPLSEFLQLKGLAQPNAVTDPPQDRVPYNQLEFFFPFDLFTDVLYDLNSFVGSNWFQIENGKLDSIDSFAQVNSISLQHTSDEQFNSVIDATTNSFLEAAVIRTFAEDEDVDTNSLGDKETLVIRGFKDLEEHFGDIGTDLQSLDIGIDGLRIARSPLGNLANSAPQKVYVNVFSNNSKFNAFQDMKLQWKQPHTSYWLNIEDASQGQRDVIMMLLAMSVPAASNSDFSATRFVLIDEFDQHLHPTATARFLEIAHRRAISANQRVILSTHSVPILSDSSVRQAPRIYSRRLFDGTFEFSQIPPVTKEALAEELGVNLFQASTLTRLFVVVEGEHDEVVLRKLLDLDGLSPPMPGIEIINARGTWAFHGIWNNVLRYQTAPVLIVYDKRSEDFENKWTTYQSTAHSSPDYLPTWSSSDFKKMQQEIRGRASKKISFSGDDELEKMIGLIEDILGGRLGNPRLVDVSRIFFHGISSPDIVKQLPIKNFLRAANQHLDWDQAELAWKSIGSKNAWGKDFKEHFKITTASVQTAVDRMETWPDELQRLFARINTLYLNTDRAD